MTDLIDRYLAAVARDLPEAQRADITAELRDEIMSEIEAREDELGRPLSRSELEADLVAFGHPLVVAGRYRRTRYLIGPEVFPFWWAGLRAALSVVAALHVALIILVIVGGEATAQVVDGAAPSLISTLIFTFGGVTLVCAGIERWGKPRFLARWKPANLPPAQGKTRSRFEILVEIMMGFGVLLWWTGVIHFRNVMPVVELRVDLAPVWRVWFWPIAAYFTGELAMNLHSLLRPGRVRLNRILMLMRNLVGAAILVAVLRDGHIVVVSSPYIPPDVLTQVQANFDRGFRVGLVATILIFLWLSVVQVWRLRQLPKGSD
ncbi:MAG: hypothetical protein GC203_06105 [Phenylobacterium sp.]|uniref:hypothetical protein n=1 Tax=Phenylobacterium sp. TaxID=1871053 RepID=UPI0025E02AF3|nr:hypothetical protein [Phenylobacterium sp.]MBI1197418.1 hypothetical protein [Phenylobacterium sp.]